jgi:hypothetical protein
MTPSSSKTPTACVIFGVSVKPAPVNPL